MTREPLPTSATAQRRDLRYGENPHQKARWMQPSRSIGRAVAGAPGQGALVHEPAGSRRGAPHRARVHRAGGGRHQAHESRAASRPATTIADAYVRAREADPLSAFGGIVGLNRPIDAETATALTSTFIEAVIAPSIDDEARAILAAKPNLRVVTADFEALRMPTDGERACRGDARSFLGGVPDAGAAIGSTEARRALAGSARLAEGRDEAAADGRRVDRAALRVARLRAREVEHVSSPAPIARWRSAPGR